MRRSKYRYLTFTAVAVLIAVIGVATVSGNSILPQFGTPNVGVPDTFTYSGYITDSSGAPVSDTRNITFSLYDRAAGGNRLWSERHRLRVADGLFSVELGNQVSIDRGFAGRDVWLGIQVDSNDEMKPRQKVTAAPFAIRAKEAITANNAEALGGVPAADYVTQDELAGQQTGTGSGDICNLEGRLRTEIYTFPITDECAPPKQQITFNGTPQTIMDFGLSNDGLPVLAVTQGSSTDTAVVVCTDITCANRSFTSIAGTAPARAAALTFTQSGLPRIGFVSSVDGALKLIECADVQCQSSTVRVINDDPGLSFGHVDIITNNDGSLLFAYNSTNGESFGSGFEGSLHTTHCTNASCTNVTSTVHQTSGFSGGPAFGGAGTGQHPVLQIQQNGLPRITYTWSFNQRLMMANCTNVRCSDSTLDDLEVAIVGAKDIGFADDGERPIIVYHSTEGIVIHEACRRVDTCTQFQKETVTIDLDGVTVNNEADLEFPKIHVLDGNIPIFAYYHADIGLVHGRCADWTCDESVGAVVLDDAAFTYNSELEQVRFFVDPATGERFFASGTYYVRCDDKCGI